mmetsp:Transcript_85643/g.262034  ORF Transcript_85643/g.262034 Transcript_85643/m.262034 type:complete len:257 (-) Transcript_85643:467-1237(-)
MAFWVCACSSNSFSYCSVTLRVSSWAALMRLRNSSMRAVATAISSLMLSWPTTACLASNSCCRTKAASLCAVAASSSILAARPCASWTSVRAAATSCRSSRIVWRCSSRAPSRRFSSCSCNRRSSSFLCARSLSSIARYEAASPSVVEADNAVCSILSSSKACSAVLSRRRSWTRHRSSLLCSLFRCSSVVSALARLTSRLCSWRKRQISSVSFATSRLRSSTSSWTRRCASLLLSASFRALATSCSMLSMFATLW